MASFPISSLLPDLPQLKIVDVGAMALGADTDPYARLTRALRCEVIGFEPLEAECELLNLNAGPDRAYLPYAVGDGSEQTFHRCNAGMTSSLFEPNTALLALFHELEELVRVVETRRVQTRRLDDIPQASGADYLKVDVQGGELMVFQGAVNLLRGVLVVHTEAEFVPLYKGQPLFAELDQFLRKQGFLLHRLADVSGRRFRALELPPGAVSANQFLWCDAVYVRDFTAFDQLSAPQLLKLAAILHENYGSHDLAAAALQAHDRQTGDDRHPRYAQRLPR